ncbi:MAG: endonuclease III [Planctomycetes bacterium]|nr:endonuclease III [Planctomycetota bacterium]
MLAKEFRPTAADLADASGRAAKILGILKKVHTDAKIALKYSNPLELLVATVLSAQCTDVRVNIVTGELFKKYREAGDYVAVAQEELEGDIRSTGFFRNKAKSIKGACGDIVEKFEGEVPGNMEDLLSLAGVGRKTANVILGNAFGVPGLVTDTHVIRLSRLMGFSDQVDPVKLEFALMELVPKKDWTFFSHLMIFHGRRICMARKPACEGCPVKELCSYGRNVGTEE